jgi:hypothetical protein
LLAADFWEKKEFTSWNDKEVEKLLKDSPWAKRTYVKYENKPMDPGARGPGKPPMGNVAGMGGMGGGGFGGMGGGGFGGGMGGMGGGGGEPVPVIVRWHSSLPIKQAVAILRYDEEVENSEEAAEMLNRQESAHIVGVIGIPGQKRMFDMYMKSIKERSQLVIEEKPPIQAVEVFTNQDGENIDLYVAFPRYQNNEPLISLEDKKIEVLIEYDSGFRITRIKKEFKLKDMQYQGKLEI